MIDGEVRCTREGAVARVVFDRPQARNAMTWRMYEQLEDICAELREDAAVRAVVFRGAGGQAFIAGTDIAQFSDFTSAEDGVAYEQRMEAVLTALETLPMPTLAVVEGWAVGGGLAIAACCDFRIATPNTRFGVPIARTLGNCLSMSNLARLSALIGPARVKDVIFTARLIDAREAHQLGLLGEVVEDGAALGRRADELARLIAGHAPLTLQATKEALRRLQPRLGPGEGEDLIMLCYTSRDFREGMDAFLGKRPPQWTGT